MSVKELTPSPQPQAPIKENASMETKPEEVKVETPAAPAVEAAAPAPAPETPVKEAAKTVVAESKAEEKAEEKKEEKAEEKKEEAKKEAGFNIHFIEGSTFDKSYFVAQDKGEFRPVKASRIIPADVQAKIVRALATTGKPPEDVVTPAEVIDQMLAQGVNDIPTFEAAVKDLTTAASLRKTAGADLAMAWNAAEVPAPAKAGEAPLMSMQKSEAEAGRKAIPLPSGSSSPVRQYYGRLPGSSATGAEVTNAMNKQSMRDKIDFMRKALEEMKAKNEELENKAKEFKGKAEGLEKEKADAGNNAMLESIVKDLLAKKLLDMKDEQSAISALAKIERKSLPQVAALLKLLGKSEKAAVPPMLGHEEKKPPMGEEKVAKSSTVVLPQFLNENETDPVSGADFLSKYW
jgi:hypothetical protein